jgi:hypothetical protein
MSERTDESQRTGSEEQDAAAPAAEAAQLDELSGAGDLASADDLASAGDLDGAGDVDSAASEAGVEPPIWSAGSAGGAASVGSPGPVDSPASPVTRTARSRLLRPRNLVIAGIAAAAVISAAVFGPMAWEVWSEKDVKITTPTRVAGLALDDSQGAHDTIDYLRTAIETGVSLDKTTGAVYADEAGESRSVLFVGGTGVLVTPEQALSKTFGLITDDAGGVDSVHDVPAGPLGGVMRCGTTKTEGTPMAVCGWADHGSLGIAMFPNRPVDQSAELLRTMRKAMQSRG